MRRYSTLGGASFIFDRGALRALSALVDRNPPSPRCVVSPVNLGLGWVIRRYA
jgi:hypothetical protein